MTDGLMASCFVPGIPIPKGSTKAFPFTRKNGKLGVSVTNANDKTKPWQDVVAEVAKKELSWNGVVWTGAVSLSVQFMLPRPKSLRNRTAWHTKRPDLDKLARSVGDALTGVAYVDDSQVVGWLLTKAYAEPNGVGVHITVRREQP